MSFSYPLDIPAQLPSSLTMMLQFVVSTATSPFTRQQQTYKFSGEQWMVECGFHSMTREQAEEWNAFFLRLRGSYGTFLLGDPSARMPRGAATGTPMVDGAGQTGYTLATKGWTASTAGILKKGDYIQLGSGADARLHKLTANADSDASGNAVLEIVPALRTSPADNAALIIENAKGVFRLAGNAVSWTVAVGQECGFSLSAVEAL